MSFRGGCLSGSAPAPFSGLSHLRSVSRWLLPLPPSGSMRQVAGSRQREPLEWAGILTVVWRERGRQLPWVGAILAFVFLFWSIIAHMSFALFLGRAAMTNVLTSWDVYMTPTGFTMLVFQVVIGGAVAFLTFALTVVSLPLLVDKEIDFVTAMLISVRTVARNKLVMCIWAAIIAVSLLVAMLPLFLGLLVALPVLGHATWHIYRRTLYIPLT